MTQDNPSVTAQFFITVPLPTTMVAITLFAMAICWHRCATNGNCQSLEQKFSKCVMQLRNLFLCSRIFYNPTICLFTTRQSSFRTRSITVPKVGILNFGSGFRWRAVLESVQRNPLTNAVTLQSIPLFRRFLRSEFRCNAFDSTIKYLKHSDLAVDSTKRCSGLRRWPQWNPPLAAVDSTAVF